MHNKFIFLNNHKIYYFILLSLVFFIVSTGVLYSNIEGFEKRLKNMLLHKSITHLDETLTNVIDDMVQDSPNFVYANITEKSLRLKNEDTLNLLDTNEIKSLYVLFVKEGRLFFLLDTSDTERENFKETFIPEDELYFDLAIKEKVKQLFIQEEVGNLGFTLIKPIVQNKKAIGLLVVDYSESSLSSLSYGVNVGSLGIVLFIIIAMLTLFIYYILHLNFMKYKMYYNLETNTLNRSFLTDHYEKIDCTKYYVILADLDFFKRINNLYGQKNGDKVITSVIIRMASFLRKQDKFIQYSGEEFLLLISKHEMSIDVLKNLLEEIRIDIEKTNFSIVNEQFSLTVSMGALLYTELERSLQNSIHKADTALYKAKYSGRNKISYFDISEKKLLRRERLKELIESVSLICYYQPIRSLIDGKLHHYEALMRIEDGDNLIFPDQILPYVENSYLYSYMTKQIIDFNLNKLRTNLKMKIAINVSGDDLINDSVILLFEQNSDLSDRLFIEILESSSIDYEKVERSIQKLKGFGYKICIDDFGAGYANMNHLLNLSIDYLKLDGSIIKEINHDKRAYSIVKTFAHFCQENNIAVIAEFIDDQEVVDILKGFGVEYGQGWYFSKALPYEELEINKE